MGPRKQFWMGADQHVCTSMNRCVPVYSLAVSQHLRISGAVQLGCSNTTVAKFCVTDTALSARGLASSSLTSDSPRAAALCQSTIWQNCAQLCTWQKLQFFALCRHSYTTVTYLYTCLMQNAGKEDLKHSVTRLACSWWLPRKFWIMTTDMTYLVAAQS